MKGSNLTSIVKKAGMVTMLVVVFATSVAAQKIIVQNKEIKENAVKSLILGISHENEGVRKASIYYAGKYMLAPTVDALIEQLTKENEPSLRLLIVLSLYNIGESRGLDAIYKSAVADKDLKVKRICNAIYAEMKKAKNLVVSYNKNM